MEDKKEIWVVAFSDHDYCYVGETAIFTNEEDAKKCFEERKAMMKIDYKDEVVFYEEDETFCEGYADSYANDTICSLSYFPREVNGEWVGNLDW